MTPLLRVLGTFALRRGEVYRRFASAASIWGWALPGELLWFLLRVGWFAARGLELFDDGLGQMRFDLAAQ